jgi:GGDEF domain-containing protein
MISIKKYLKPETETEQTLLHIMGLLLEGVGSHIVASDTVDATHFRTTAGECRRKLFEHVSTAELLMQVGSVVHALETYTTLTSEEHRRQLEEMRKMVTMLTGTLASVSKASQTSVHRLIEIEGEVAGISALDDVRKIKARLGDCLADLRREAEQQRKVTSETIQQLTLGLREAQVVSQRREGTGGATDPLTGLPMRVDAEDALEEPAAFDSRMFAAVIVLQGLQSVNQKFGQKVGSDVLAEFARLVQKHLPAGDRLFRWGGPTLVIVMSRTGDIERPRADIGGMLNSNWECNLQMSSHNILLPLRARWVILPAGQPALGRCIDAFAADIQPHLPSDSKPISPRNVAMAGLLRNLKNTSTYSGRKI